MKNELNLIGYEGENLTIREGKALDLQPPVKIKLSGNIETVTAFLKKRWTEEREGRGLQTVDSARAIVIVDQEAMKMTLYLDPENFFGTEVEGKLEFTPELEQFHINSTKMFNREELVKLLRFNKRFFPNLTKYEELLKAYQSLQISTGTEVKQGSDTRGNKNNLFIKEVNSQHIPTEFVLDMPIFKGQKHESFRVEICLDATDASVRFWFESVELAELIEIRKKEIFDAQLVSCQDFVIIHK